MSIGSILPPGGIYAGGAVPSEPIWRLTVEQYHEMIRNGILSGWIVVFANSLRDLSASVLLYTSATTVIATAIMDVYYASAWGAVAALSVILLAINTLAIAAGYGIFGRNVLSPNV